jgi:LysM repeat protein
MPKTLSQAVLTPVALASVLCAVLAAGSAQAQNFPITAEQRAAAAQVAQSGVGLGDLRADAPHSYTIKSGDTLWAISGLFLKSPWRWPQLWGMNLADIQNPHLIYPGQTLFLIINGDRVSLSTQASEVPTLPTVKLSPRTRVENLAGNALTTLRADLIAPFLSEPVIVDPQVFNNAPRIVAAQDGRVLLTRGDRAYARSTSSSELVDDRQQKQKAYRVFRNATALNDPVSGEVLGFEAEYVGKALLARGETSGETLAKDGSLQSEIVPATIDIVDAKAEMRVGDRLLPEPPQQLQSYVPHAPDQALEARIVSVYGSAVVYAAQNQVVVINKGLRDGIESGHVLAILQDGARLVDKTDATRPTLKLPDERNGLLMVFRPFEKLSYALVLDITSGVKVGDRLTNPR